MPDLLHPPFSASAVIQPRQLVRWLDVNAQGGQLDRTQSFITLPAFSQAVTWKGYSDIVTAYNFEGPNWFSLKYLNTGSPNRGLSSPIPLNPNYMLCIMYVKAGVVVRYALWRGVGEVIYFPLPLYTGQPIGRNFRLEVWSTNASPAIQVTPLTVYTSVRGTLDYRYGNDFTLVSADIPCTAFGNIGNTPLTLPYTPTLWLLPSGMSALGNFASWTDSITADIFLNGGAAGAVTTVVPSGDAFNDPAVQINATSGTNRFLENASNFVAQTYVLLFNAGEATHRNLFQVQGGGNLTLAWNAGVLTADTASVAGLSQGHWYTAIITSDGASTTTLYVYDAITCVLVGSNTVSSYSTGNQPIYFGPLIGMYLSAATFSQTLTKAQTLIVAEVFAQNYFATAGNFNMPLTFPANSVPVTN